MFFSSLAAALLLVPSITAQFVTTQDGQFTVNGTDLRFIGTTAYWLSALNNDQDIYDTLANMSASGVKVVRTWAFNDVSTIPDDDSTWFQLISPDGTVTLNEGANGLGKLDTIVRIAEELGIYVHLSLTNNWNPQSNGSSTTTRPRNSLSNDYGGMDAYVRSLSANGTHDQFYTDENIVSLFESYTTKVVSRYVNSSAIFAWEVANDPRCASSIPASSACTPQTVTSWHSRLSKHIRAIDPNHLVSSGSHGFFCVDCPKLFPRTTTAAAPATSARPAVNATPAKRKAAPLTRSRLIAEKKRALRAESEAKRSTARSGPSIRGRWAAGPVTRQASDLQLGSAFNGAYGVDSEDILNIPEVGFGTFQLFPDQNTYESTTTGTDPFQNVVASGVDWIQRHGEASQLYGKPVALTGFGLVSQDNAASFVPFSSADPAPAPATPFVTNAQRAEAYSSWVNAAADSGVNGAIQYQWGQSSLQAQEGSAIQSQTTESGQSTNVEQSGISPNDGYSQQISDSTTQQFFESASQEIGGTA